ncbi:hypothetical protein [Bartonella sp. AU18XJBT]|uniref:hypothetical protein n=1 Tax=Bartonella sp. AU18XJBT TaxID=3019089 RepID=UPI00235E5829|nr:hypothetical protein [Bartonella sp. AU18XJBT]
MRLERGGLENVENIVDTIGNEGSSSKRRAINFLGVWGGWHIGAVWWLIESFIERRFWKWLC